MKKTLWTAALIVGLGAYTASASLVWTIEQVDNDVVISTEGGSLDLTGAQYYYDASCGAGVSSFKGNWARVCTDLAGTTVLSWYGLNSDNQLSSSVELWADSTTGETIFFQDNSVALPVGYVSGSAIGATTLTFNNTTLADMELSLGESATYTLANDTMTLSVGAIPEPATIGLLGISFGVLWRVHRNKTYYCS